MKSITLNKPLKLQVNKPFSIVVSIIDNGNGKTKPSIIFSEESKSYNDMSFIKQNNKWFNTLNQFIKGENGSTYNGSLVARIRVVTIIEQKATDTNLANAILNLIK